MDMESKETSSQIQELTFDEVDAVSGGGVRGQIAGAGIAVAGGIVAVAGAPFIAAGIVFVGIVVVVANGGDSRPGRKVPESTRPN